MEKAGAVERDDDQRAVRSGQPSEGLPHRHRRRPPRWRKIALITGLALLLVLTAGAASSFIYYKRLDSGLRRTDAFREIHHIRPAAAPGGAQNFLLLGSDSRDSDDPTHPLQPGEARTDTMVLMHVDAARRKAYLISIPRDLYVYIPQSASHPEYGGTTAKINAAYSWGGLPLVIDTVERYTGARVDHLVMVDFEGFKKVADALGGVDVNNGQEFTSVIEPYYRTFKKGIIHLDGAAALDYVRQRQQFADGDFMRMCHQQQFMKALLDRATSTGTVSDPRKLDAFLRSVTTMLTVDQGFSLASAALQFRNIRTADLTFLTSPNLGPAMVGDESVMMPDDAKAKSLYDAVANDKVADWVSQNSTGPADLEPATCAEQ